MSQSDDSKSGDGGEDRVPEGFEDTVVEILSIGDEVGDGTGAEAGEAKVRVPSGRARKTSPEAQGEAAEIGRLETLLAAERERALRLRADFDNYRKRTERERADIERYALAETLRDLLPVVDNLERALSAQSEAGDLRKGMEMILRQFHEILKRYGLSPIPALGERFDPAVHEAVFHEESDSVTTPTVAMELQRGYRLNDRLLRPSLVKVAVPKEATEVEPSSDPAN